MIVAYVILGLFFIVMATLFIIGGERTYQRRINTQLRDMTRTGKKPRRKSSR
ncbi:hypothetical protein HUG15_14800 [Salicibibacter cibarius]|uniref:Uncharacterized protein n=1 Tax=Salicibibacter cibarius TaxID=2743000 RepID=A0A7T7CC75_9BACI|nr:hypothetical protein [Salicibibacter cibarius]QQK76709.1 hypothetical protein HUG15_14800 [Salicibibacter cibarius]